MLSLCSFTDGLHLSVSYGLSCLTKSKKLWVAEENSVMFLTNELLILNILCLLLGMMCCLFLCKTVKWCHIHSKVITSYKSSLTCFIGAFMKFMCAINDLLFVLLGIKDHYKLCYMNTLFCLGLCYY